MSFSADEHALVRCPSCGEPRGGGYGPDQVCWPCWQRRNGGDGSIPEPDGPAASREFFTDEDGASGDDSPDDVSVVSLEEFAAVDEPGAAALLGGEDDALIPEDGDVMIYGNGGAGKTTLAVDLACHLGAGKDWLGIPVPRPARVLLIENEGPRALFRKKLRRKLDAWEGSLDGAQRL